LDQTREQAPLGASTLPYRDGNAHGRSGTIGSASGRLGNRRKLEHDRIWPYGGLARHLADFYLMNGLCHRARHTGRLAYSLRTNIDPLRPTPTLAAPLATLFPTPYAPKHPELLRTDLRKKIETTSEGGGLGIDISCAKHARHIPFKRSSPDLSLPALPSSSPLTSPFAVSSLAISTTPQARIQSCARSTPSHSFGMDTAAWRSCGPEDFEGFEGLSGWSRSVPFSFTGARPHSCQMRLHMLMSLFRCD
jgi:hypothetical protein